MAIKRAYTVNNVLSKKFHTLDFQGQWLDTLGQPDKAFSAIVWGGSGSGKTDFMIQLGKYLCTFGRVAYNSLEEGLSHTFQMALERHFMAGVDGRFVLLDREPFPELVARMQRHKSPDFLIIDSVQYMGITRPEYKELKELMKRKRKGIIFLSHAQGREPKGALAQFIRYDVDIKITVEGFRAFADGRINGGGLPYTIWPEGAARYHSEII